MYLMHDQAEHGGQNAPDFRLRTCRLLAAHAAHIQGIKLCRQHSEVVLDVGNRWGRRGEISQAHENLADKVAEFRRDVRLLVKEAYDGADESLTRGLGLQRWMGWDGRERK